MKPRFTFRPSILEGEPPGAARSPRSDGGDPRLGRRPARVVVAGLHAESNPRNGRPIVRSDFDVVAGDAVLRHRDFVRLDGEDVTLLGGYRARAVSGGFVDAAVLETLTSELVAHVTAVEDVDGILLCTHGAMRTQEDSDADGTWIAAVRERTPASVPIVGVFDTHGTPSLRTLRTLDGVATYRSVPHVDQIATMQRGLGQIRRRIEGAERPHVVFEPVALRLPSERAPSRHGPLRWAIDQLASLPDDVADAEVFVGQAWAPVGVPTVGVVAMGRAEGEARRFAKRIADGLWQRRDQFAYPVPALDLAGLSARLERIGAAKLVVADSGDVPGAGARGDRLDLVDLALECGTIAALVVGVSIPRWIDACVGHLAGVATELRHPESDRRYEATIVMPVREVDARGRCAVVAIGPTTVVVVDWRGDPPEPDWLAALGLDLAAYPMIVLKTGFIPEAYLEGREPLLALTPGLSEHRVDPRGP